MLLYNFLGKVESAPIIDTMLKEVVGINLPRIAVTRTSDERRDVFYSEVGNTIGFFGTGVALDQLLIRVLNPTTLLKQSTFTAHWGAIGRSAALFSTAFAVMWAMPFIRNYLTAQRTGSTKFTQVIGAHSTQANTRALQQSLTEYKQKALTILGLGLAGSILAVGGARLAIARQWGQTVLNRWFKAPKSWIHQLILRDGRFAHFGGLPALLFWGVPAYGGWIQASRDSYERKEQVLKFINFTACFFGPALVLQRHFQKKLQKLLGPEAELSYQYIHDRLRMRHLKDPQAKSSSQKINDKLQGPPENQIGITVEEKLQTLGLPKPTVPARQLALEGSLQNQAFKIWATKSGLSLLSSIVLLSTMPQLINIYLTKRRLARNQNQPMPSTSLGHYPAAPYYPAQMPPAFNKFLSP